MNRLTNKLKNNSGASMIIALLFFLICATVGISVLAAAKANAGRLLAQRENEQAYLTVRSAAQLMRSSLDEPSPAFALKTETSTVFPGIDEPIVSTIWDRKYNPHTLSLANTINEILYDFLQTGSIKTSKSFQLTFTAEDMEDVAAHVTITEKSGKYYLSADFSIPAKDDYNYYMSLTMTGELITSSNIISSATDESGISVTVSETSYTVKWMNGRLKNS